MKIPIAFLQEAKTRCTPEVECVALLFGKGDYVYKWRWVKNVLESPTAFKIDPEEMYKAIAEAEREELDLVAIFHAHPNTPTPSLTDLHYMKFWKVVWIISDIYTWETTAWILKDVLEKIPLELT